MTCNTCNGIGLVLVSLARIGFGPGFMSFMTAGLNEPIRRDDGTKWHEIVCPACDGSGDSEIEPCG